jgi:hypothetical protein
MKSQRLHRSTFYASSAVLLWPCAAVFALGAFWNLQAGKIGIGLAGIVISPLCIFSARRAWKHFRFAREEEKLWDPSLRRVNRGEKSG